jgi:hypothetical protein
VTPLHEDRFFTFRFAEDRLIPRFHLEGVPPGRQVQVYSANPQTLEPTKLLTTAVVGEAGWVDISQPILVRAGDVFVVFPDREGEDGRTIP